MLEELIKSIPKELLNESGEVFYSGKNAFSGRKKIYILGINPGGSEENHIIDTVKARAEFAVKESKKNPNWSEYQDGHWDNSKQGNHRFQLRVQHLLKKLKLSPYEVPASNLVFVRSPREAGLSKEKYQKYAELCWTFHQTVIKKLGITTIICFGNTPGNFVRQKLNTKKNPIAIWSEKNNRKWKTKVYENDQKQRVIVVPHPSVSDWKTKACDPSEIIAKHINHK